MFPLDFNSNSDFVKLRKLENQKDLRDRIYKHIITNGKKEQFKFFNFSKEDILHKDNIELVSNELNKLGFQTKILFGGTSLLIYVNKEEASIWLNEELCELS